VGLAVSNNSTLIDTGIIIRHLRNDSRANQLLDYLERKGDIKVSVITLMEILVGCRSQAEEGNSLLLFERVLPLSVNKDIAAKAALLIKKYPKVFGKGIQRGTPDAIIAATTWQENRVLITLNTRQFAKIPISEIQINAIDQNKPDWTVSLSI
jgi:predicted nucleic acid-binding protein